MAHRRSESLAVEDVGELAGPGICPRPSIRLSSLSKVGRGSNCGDDGTNGLELVITHLIDTSLLGE